MRAYYGFGDASGAGFGATIELDDGVQYQYGQWSAEITEKSSSNWRELANLVHTPKSLVSEKELRGLEIFIFTDNQTAEAAYWKGTSTSPKLFELVLKLRRMS